MTVGATDPETAREGSRRVGIEQLRHRVHLSVGQFKAPVAGRYRVRFKGYTLWVAPLAGESIYLADWDTSLARPPRRSHQRLYAQRRAEPARGQLRPDSRPAVHDMGEVWLVAGETLVPDASRLYRSRPNNFRNPLMTPDGAPAWRSNGWKWRARSTTIPLPRATN